MLMKFLRAVIMSIVLLLLVTMIIGCNFNIFHKQTKFTDKNSSEKTKLVWYIMGNSHVDTPIVMEKLNNLLENDYNCSLELNFINWNDWKTKYLLLLSTGEEIDMIFTSNWSGFYKYATQGAFMDLTNLIPKYAPNSLKNIPKEDWQCVSLQDKIYAIPCTLPEYTPNGWAYREDLRKQLNLPEIKDLSTIETYLDGIKKTFPNITPIDGAVSNEIFTLFKNYYGFEDIGGEESGLIKTKAYTKPRDIIIYPFTEEYEQWCKKMKSWADKGYWSRDALTSKVKTFDSFLSGSGVIHWANPADAAGLVAGVKAKHPEWKVQYFPFTRFYNYAIPNLPINNGMAIPKSAANPELSLRVLDEIRNNPQYYRLITYGIEGYHYDLSVDGRHMTIPAKGQSIETNGGYWIASWGWAYKQNELIREGIWEGQSELFSEFDKIKVPNILTTIYIDFSPIQSEYAAVNQVSQQYGIALMLGLVPDVNVAIANYREKLKIAGIDKVYEYIKSKTYEYLDQKDIK
jgi:putative aldouronate transport system substrate-binding protein